MKKSVLLILGILFFVFWGCSTPKTVKKESVTSSYQAEVVSVKGVLVGEFKEGSKVIVGNTSGNIPTWEGFKLGIRTTEGKYFEYLSRDLYYDGDGILITVRDGKIIKVKYKP